MEINNTVELNLIIGTITKNAVDFVMDKIVDTIQGEINAFGIGLEYDYEDGAKHYQPTGEFYSAWRKETTTLLGDYIDGMMGYDPEMITTYSPENFIHGSTIGGINDVRDGLADIIFNAKAGDLFGQGYWTQSRDAWGSTLNIVRANIWNWFKQGCATQGLMVAKGR